MSHEMYDRLGEPIDSYTFERLRQDKSYVILADDRIDVPGWSRPVRVITKWIGVLKTIADPLFVTNVYDDPAADGIDEVCHNYEHDAFVKHDAIVKRYQDLADVRCQHLDNGGAPTLVEGAL